MAGRSLSYVRFRLARWGGVRQATGSVERNLSYVMSAPLYRKELPCQEQLLHSFSSPFLGYFFSFNEECYQTSACEIVSAFRKQFLDRFFSD